MHHAILEVVHRVDALVADDRTVLRVRAFAKGAARGQSEQEGMHLPCEARPGVAVAPLEARPARAALDAVDDEQLPPPEREQRTLGASTRATRQRLQLRGAGNACTDCVQRVDALRRELLAVGLGQQLQRARAGTQQDLLVGQAVPGRSVRIHARERTGNRAAVGERLVATAQPVESLHARETDERGIALEREFAQAL